MQSKEEKRYEIKIPLQIDQLYLFESALKSINLYPQKIYENRIINSIYLDTPHFKSYFDNVSGSSKRVKIRLRYYNDDIKNIRLEYKIKNNRSSLKKVFDILNNNFLDIRDKSNILKLCKNINIKKDLLTLYPTLEIRYEREYFKISDNIRMTIDRNIKYRKLYPIKNSFFFNSPVFGVVEFKYPFCKKDEIKRILLNIPFRVFRHSKYVIGMDTACIG